MKIIYLFVMAFFFNYSGYSQNYKINRGEEIKMDGSSNELDILNRDNSGVYIVQGRVKANRLSMNNPYSNVYSLYKFDKNYSLVYDKDYKKELNDYDLNSFQALNGELFMFATGYNKKEKSYTLYGTKINKNSGEPDPGFQEINTYSIQEKDDNYKMKITTTDGGNSFLMVAKISMDALQILTVTVLDASLRKKQNTIIRFPFGGSIEHTTDQVLYEKGKIFILGTRRNLIKGKNNVDSQAKHQVLMVYNSGGKIEKELELDMDHNLITREKLIQLPGEGIIIAGFYNGDRSKNEINGFVINKFNAEAGELEKSSHKEINPAMFANSSKDIPARFPNQFHINSMDVIPADNGIIITAELSYSDNSSSSYDKSVSWGYVSKDILVVHADKFGEIGWMNIIPKLQTESYGAAQVSSGYGYTLVTGGGMPYYSSYTSLIKGNKLLIILNDDASNTTNPKYGTPLNNISNFKKTNLYEVSVDLSTGKMDRKLITSNDNDDILAPRHSFVSGNEILMPTWRSHFVGKSEFRLVQITIE